MTTPRVLAIMGSGEVGPRMAKVHRELFGLFGDGPAPAVLIDTPYGFQENADLISARIVDYFRERIGREMAIASYRRNDVDPIASAEAFGLIREARYLLAGPGSPSYALRHWRDGPVQEALDEKLADGGIVVMASAAALTLGVATAPVYEIYKVGAEPTWLEGLDLLGRATGLRAAVIPHYDNAEGGDHDTRFCYLGERRLAMLEAQLPDDAFVLGVDGHTALVLDLERGWASVAGLGGVTLRVAGRSTRFRAGTEVRLEALAEAGDRLRAGSAADAAAESEAAERDVAESDETDQPLREETARLEGAIVESMASRDANGAVGAMLELESAIEAHTRAGEDSTDLDAARATFQALIARLGDAVAAARPPEETVGPFVDALLDLRARARTEGDWPTADLIRDRLTSGGVEVHDDADGATTWSLPGATG
jgi:cyanophycinase-like exopeptidase